MNWFKWKQWLLAFCVATTVNVQGATLDEWGESTPPISYQSTEEESKYEFWNSDPHEYLRIDKREEGYYGQRSKQILLQLPSYETQFVYLKASLKDPNQANTITFQIQEQDQTFTEEGAIWIMPSDCSRNGSAQDIPFGVRVTAPGTYFYTIDAYVNQDDESPVATLDAAFFFMENTPSLSLPTMVYDDQFILKIKKGDLEQTAYVVVELWNDEGYDPLVFSTDGFDLLKDQTNRWANSPKQLVDEEIVCQVSTEGKGVAHCQVRLKDADGCDLASTSCDICYPFLPDPTDTDVLHKLVEANSTCTELVEYIQKEQWKLDYDENIRIEWTRETPSHISSLSINNQTEPLALDLSQLKSLKSLNLYNNNNITSPFDLSDVTQLQYIYLSSTNLTYKDIQFPVGFERKNVYGESKIRGIGIVRNEWSVELPINSVLNFEDYIGKPVEGSHHTYSWRMNGQDIELTPAEDGSFKLFGKEHDSFTCTIRNDSFPNWSIETPDIDLVQGELFFDETEVAALKQLATDNPQNQELQDFVKNEGWKKNELDPENCPIGVKWAVDEENIAHVSHLQIRLNDCSNQEIAPTKMNLSAFPELVYFYSSSNEWVDSFDFTKNTKLQELTIENAKIMTSLDLSKCPDLKSLSFWYNTALTSLDLSSLTKLENVYFGYGCSLSYTDVIFPDSFNKERVDGTTCIQEIGSPRENGDVEVPINTILDLSAFVGELSEDGSTICSWRKNWQDIELNPVEEGSLKFKLFGEIGDHFSCTIRNNTFPNWSMETPQIYLIMGELNYNEADVAGLKKLATDNQQNQEILDFITNEGWKEQNWDDWNSPIRVKWSVDENNNARLSHLRLNLNGCYNAEIAPTRMDLSAFTELVYFNTSSNYYIDEMDFSKNTKLKEIYFEYANTMTQIDLSPCKNLKTLWLNHLHAIESVDLSANQKLEVLKVEDDELLNAIKLSSCSELRELEINSLESIVSIDLSANQKLTYLQVYNNSKLKTLNVSKLSNLVNLRISTNQNLEQELDLSGMEVLRSLYLANCPKLAPLTGVEKLSLNSLELEHTDSLYKEALKVLDYSTITYINYQESHYDLPESAPKLSSLVVAQSTKEVDLAHFPELGSLSMGWYSGRPALPYSGIKNYRNKSYRDENGEYHSGMSYEGLSLIPVPGTEKVLGERYPCLTEGDTIDFSSEAVIEGKQSQFVWIDCDNNTEETALFVAVEDHPGVFTINPDASRNESGEYRCRIWNEAFSDGAGVDWYNGWILETEQFKISNGETTYNLEELEMLQTIVNNSSSQGLKDWWENGQWMFDNYRGEDGSFYVYWNDNHRLDRLYIQNFNDRMTGYLNVSAALELTRLYVNYTDFTECVYPANSKLEIIDFSQSKLVLPIDQEFPSLQRLCTSEGQTQLDLSKLPALTNLWLIWNYTLSHLKFSDIKAHRKLEEVWGSWNCYWIVSDKIYDSTNYLEEKDSHIIDLSSEINVGGKIQWQAMNTNGSYQDISPMETEPGKYDLSETLLKQKKVRATCSHDSFPGWTPFLDLSLYTEQGDANIDGTVNVQDISATIPYVLNDWNNQLRVFGHYQADIDVNKAIDVADILGILNIIRGRDYSNLRSSFSPVVHLTSEEDGKLYIQTPVALAGLQFTITGADQEIPLLGEAGRFAHAGHAGDSLRMVAYSMDGSTIPAGRTLIAQLPKGATLVEAVIADEQARSLEVDLNGVVTATEDVWSDVFADEVTNSPNPFRGQTTFRYGVNESADAVVIRIYSANGMLVRVLSGLPASQGEHQYPVSLDLPQGLYYYQLEISRGGKPIRTLSNNMIIK